MSARDKYIEFLEGVVADVPRDAIALRSKSAQIISEWIRNKFNYPNEFLDKFVYIESSIEQLIYDYKNNTADLERECLDAYNFHIGEFVNAVKELQNSL